MLIPIRMSLLAEKNARDKKRLFIANVGKMMNQ